MVKMESISIIPLCQLVDLSLVSVHPSQLRVNWMVLMITIINWVSVSWVRGSRTVGTFNGQDGIYLYYPLVPINGFIIGKCTPISIKS